MQNLVKSLATEFAPKIRVNSVLLGLVDFGQWQRRFEARADKNETREAWFAALARGNTSRSAGSAVPRAARAIVFLGSPAASYITGAT